MQLLLNKLLKHKITLIILILLTYISTISELMIPLLLANALNVGISKNYGINYILKIVFFMSIFIIISIFLNTIISYLNNKISYQTSSHLKNEIFNKTLYLKNKEKYQTSTLLTRTNQDIENIRIFTNNLLSSIFKSVLIFSNCLSLLYALNKDFLPLLSLGAITLIIFLLIISKKLTPITKKLQIKLDNTNYLIQEKIKGIKLIKSYNKLDYQDEKYQKNNQEYLQLATKSIQTSSFITPILTLIVNAIIVITLSSSIQLVKTNAMETGTTLAVIQYILQILLSIMMIAMLLVIYPSFKVSINRIEEILNEETYENTIQNKLQEINTIQFNNIKYNNILNSINLTINKNELIGIIGETGSGKSLLAKLLLKEIDLQEGEILINNENITNFTRKDISNVLTYSPQTNEILTGTLLENLTFANTKANKEEILKAIHTSNLVNFVNTVPNNINYKLEQDGNNISSGQKQRIVLARSLLAKTNYLLLDEPFSSLDYKTEKEIIQNLKKYYKEKSFIIISQKVSSLIHCDKIYVLDKGKIICEGNHEFLLEKCPLYKEMYSIEKEVIEYDKN